MRRSRHSLHRRFAIAAAVALALAAGANAGADDAPDAHRFTFGIDFGLVRPSTALESWVAGGIGKLRYSEDDRGVVATRAYGIYTGRLNSAWTVHAVADVVGDASDGLDVTEAYFEWQPIPRSANRQHWKLGLFHAPWSLENTGPAWSTPLTLSPSAVNTWIGEELRPFGAEWTLRRRLGGPGSSHEIGTHAGAFVDNDPAGSLLAWKGWSLHDRQSRLHDELPLAPLPQLQPGAMFAQQAPDVAPWREVDGRVGYYAGADWRYRRRLDLSIEHYDNRADPVQIEDGQYAWHTRFEQLAAQIELPARLGLLTQWMTGSTVMGPVLVTARAVDTGFRARYVLLTRAFDEHRVSVRYDDFRVEDRDHVPNDDNSDSGRAWTLAYRYSGAPRWSLGAEWLEIHSWHPAWQYFGAPAQATERLLQVQASLRLGAPL